MRVEEYQALLAETSYYKGGIDGQIGPQTMDAVAIIERTQKAQYPENVKWSDKRRLVAAGQAILNAWKFEAGTVDGLAGHNTKEAYASWVYKKAHGKKEVVSRKARNLYKPKTKRLPRQKDVGKFYGKPGAEIRSQLTTIILPFSVRIDYKLSQRTNKITVHKKVAASLKAALIEVRKHYGEARWRKLGLDRYAGAYNHRKMRGGSRWSMHAYACAIDFYAAPNGLRMSCPQALFCKPEYKAFLDIMEKHGWLPAVRLWGKDAMHFQAARM